MEEKERSHVKYLLIKQIVFVALAICVFIFRETLVEQLRYFIGGLMIFYGLEELLFEIIYAGKHFLHKDKLYLGAIEVLFGLVLLFVSISYEGVCIIWATWSILREAFEIKEATTEVKNIILKLITLAESVAVIVLSVMLIMEPGEHHALIHMYLLLLELVLNPLIPLLDEIILEKKAKKKEAAE